jgi:hypothetical protein
MARRKVLSSSSGVSVQGGITVIVRGRQRSGLLPVAIIAVTVTLGILVFWPMIFPWVSRGAAIAGVPILCGDSTNTAIAADDDIPAGNPLNDPRTVITQGYDVGSHAPASIWGGVSGSCNRL